MVIWGSISLAQSLMRGNLIDEYRLIVCPLTLGSGRPLFSDKADSVEMRLRTTEPFDRWTVLLSYSAGKAQRASARSM